MPAVYPQQGEVWWVPFPMPSADQALMKSRPAVVVSAGPVEAARGVVVVAAISSKTEPRTEFDIFVQGRSRLAKSMGITRDCIICCSILHTFSIAALRRRAGRVNSKTQLRINKILKRFLFAEAE